MGYKKLNTSLEFVKGVGPTRSKILNQELKLKTCKDIFIFSHLDMLIDQNFIKFLK